MQNPNQPADEAPDTAATYERAKPEKESGMGRLDNNDDATPADQPCHMEKTVPNRQNPQHQINADQTDDDRHNRPLAEKEQSDNPDQPDHSMLEEEPLGWDQAPQRIENPRHKRHSRTEGRGGTP